MLSRASLPPAFDDCGNRFFKEAVAIAGQIRQHAIRSRDGSVTWVGPTGYGTPALPLRIRKLTPHLYDGTTGIALFFASLSRLNGDMESGDLALRALAPLRRKLHSLLKNSQQAEMVQIPLGGLIGLGSLIYGFLQIGKLLDEPMLLEEAHNITALITSERIARDERVRIQTGSAGAILALLALHQHLPNPNANGKTPLDLASDCAQRILDVRFSWEGLPRAWPLSPGMPPLLGFSYGAAGICCALLHLYRVVPRPELREAAEEGLAFIRSFYSPERRKWRDVRYLIRALHGNLDNFEWRDWWATGNPDLPFSEVRDLAHSQGTSSVSSNGWLSNMWCHGPAGLALSRLSTLDVLDSPEVREEIAAGLASTQQVAFTTSFDAYPVDDLCCGLLGFSDTLLYAYQTLGDGNLLVAACALAERVIERAGLEGRYRVSAARGTDVFSPSLFQGCAGVGYALLRLARPHVLPCLLLLE